MEGVDKLSVLLEVKDLRTSFNTETGVINAVNGVSFSVEREKTLGVVGESGCGKSVMSLSIMQLIRHPGKIESGEILLHRKGSSVDLTKMEPMSDEMRSIRGNEIAMIFQEPGTALNPVFRVGPQVAESLRIHQKISKNQFKISKNIFYEKKRNPRKSARKAKNPRVKKILFRKIYC